MRHEPCVCGGIISADLTDIEPAVRRHNTSLTHRVWRYAQEGPTATVLIRDVSGCEPRASVPPVRPSWGMG